MQPMVSHKLEDADNDDEKVSENQKQDNIPNTKQQNSHHALEEDNDEFVGEILEKDHPSKSKEKITESDIPPMPVPIEIPVVWYKKYLFEIIIAGLMIVYAVQFYMGQKYNKNFVGAWLLNNLEYFKEQFSAIGIEQNPDNKVIPSEGETIVRGAYIEQHSYNLFKFYATGRVNCQYCLVSLELKHRQDLLTMASFNLIWPELDKISYEVPLAFADSFPCIFAVCRRNEMKQILENNKILKDYTTQRHVEGLSKNFAVLSEYEEIVTHILNPQVFFHSFI